MSRRGNSYGQSHGRHVKQNVGLATLIVEILEMFTQRKATKTAKDIRHEEAVQREQGTLDYGHCPECRECGELYSPRRAALGYSTCLDCGTPRKTYAVVPVAKSNYVIATNIEAVRSPYSHKGNR